MRTNAGSDWQSGIMGSAQAAPANYIALTANTTAPAATDTTLSGELAAASGGLVRALAAYAHTTGSPSYTLTKTFTMNANDGSTVTPAKLGVFTASSGGTMAFESLIPNPPALVPGDSVAITETVNI